MGGMDKLFHKQQRGGRKFKKLPSVVSRDPVTVMTSQRFEHFKKFLPYAFEGNDPDDPWNQIIGLVNGFNLNRMKNIAASVKKILDETMCGFQPRSTPTGGLPHFSFVGRKPRPYGTEFKTLVCAVTSKFEECVHAIYYICYSLLSLQLQRSCFILKSSEVRSL